MRRRRIFKLRYLLAEKLDPTGHLKHRHLLAQQLANQQRLLEITQAQGPLLLKALVEAVNGGIGQRVGLGTKRPGFSGSGPLARH